MKKKQMSEIDRLDKDVSRALDGDLVSQVVEEAFVEDLIKIKKAK